MTKIKNFKNYINEQITVDDYFFQYHNFPKGALSSLTHKDIKKLLPFVKRKKCDEITREDILTGDIILVQDHQGIVLGYKNPLTYIDYENHIKECEKNSKVEIIITVEDSIDQLEEINLDNLSNYELELLLKESKLRRDHKMTRLVQKELYFRPEHNHSKKQKKLERVMEKEIRKEEL